MIYLASSSPRRRELLALLDVPFEVISADIDESILSKETPEEHVTRLACEKSQAVLAQLPENTIVIGADTIVVVDGEVLGKPKNQAHAIEMLTKLSGRQHQTMTAVAVSKNDITRRRCVITDVSFRQIQEDEMIRYWESGEPQDKAGAYGIQGRASRFISRIEGSYHAVMGLPMMETEQLLKDIQQEA
ncbi:Maf family protein [Algicola sagamiensis]|uniref:Maf family protein n=1 Tax=Algicola sagamiensis TaxID=163869 RepID=UPI00036DD0F8|nr:Maf family protein [Algicola sagamiensis]